MSIDYSPGLTNFGLLPERERNPGSLITSMVINGLILVAIFYVGAKARHVVEKHDYENTVLIVPVTQAPAKIKLPEPPRIQPPELPKLSEVKIEAPKPDLNPIQVEAMVQPPTFKAASPTVVLVRQLKAALTAAMPAQSILQKRSTAPVHLGETFGVTPNPNASRPSTVAAIGNPYGGMQGPAAAPHGAVGSTGIGNGLSFGSNAGAVGKVASVGIPGTTGTGSSTGYTGAKVALAVIPTAPVAAPLQQVLVAPTAANLEVLSKPSVQYTSEARELKIQGDVVLRVTFTSTGRVVVQSVVHGLGHGLDEEACRAALQIRFHPATSNGQAVDLTTKITITFQLV